MYEYITVFFFYQLCRIIQERRMKAFRGRITGMIKCQCVLGLSTNAMSKTHKFSSVIQRQRNCLVILRVLSMAIVLQED
jgi:hypothetical protein